MASFDVKSLFTYIPAQFTINLISDQIFVQNGKTFCCLPKNPVKKVIDLVMYRSRAGTMFQFNYQEYERIDEFSIDSPIAPYMADLCMSWVLNEAFINANIH